MKILPALLILVSAISISAAGPVPVPNSELSWKPVIGFSSPGAKGYYDKNSLSTVGEGKKRIAFGIILLIKDKPEIVKIGKKTFMAKSVTRALAMDCESGGIMPIGDLYYATEFPKERDVALHSVEYDTTTSMIIGNKNSVLYGTLCAIPI